MCFERSRSGDCVSPLRVRLTPASQAACCWRSEVKWYRPESRQVRRAFYHTSGYGLPVVVSKSGKTARRVAIRDRRQRREMVGLLGPNSTFYGISAD
jgi:hypothetical protein